MAGLTLKSSTTFALGGAVPVSTTGTQTVTMAAFSPGATPTTTGPHALSPTRPFGISFWVGVGAIALLVVIRHSLPR